MAEPSEDDPPPEENPSTVNDNEHGIGTDETVGGDDTSSDSGDATDASETSQSDPVETESLDGSALERGGSGDGPDESADEPTSSKEDAEDVEATAGESGVVETGNDAPETADGATTDGATIDDAASDAFEETDGSVDPRSTDDVQGDVGVPSGNGERPADTAPLDDASVRQGDDASPDLDEDVSSLAGRAKPALAERQALVAVAGAMGLGVGGAVVGMLLDMTVRDVKSALALGGLLILTMAAFVLFRAMLSAAERNDEPAKTALTHPLFMLLFVVLATATALFIGLVRQAY